MSTNDNHVSFVRRDKDVGMPVKALEDKDNPSRLVMLINKDSGIVPLKWFIPRFKNVS